MTARRWRAALAAAACLVGGHLAADGCVNSPASCDAARTQIQMQIDAQCAEPPYAHTAFCACCVPNGYYAIDDDCSCQTLVFDADACLYDDSPNGGNAVSDALSYAASVCVNRAVVVPDHGDAGTAECAALEAAPTGAGGSGGGGGTSAGGGGGSGAASTSTSTATSTATSTSTSTASGSAGGGGAAGGGGGGAGGS